DEVGAVERQTLELGGAAPGGGCFAARGGAPVVYVLAPAACKALEPPLASRRVFEIAADEVGQVSAFGVTAERHAGAWDGADGAGLDAATASNLAALVRLLATAPEVAGYGAIAGVPVVLGDVRLRMGKGEYGLEGRPVRYKVPDEICKRWPPACR